MYHILMLYSCWWHEQATKKLLVSCRIKVNPETVSIILFLHMMLQLVYWLCSSHILSEIGRFFAPNIHSFVEALLSITYCFRKKLFFWIWGVYCWIRWTKYEWKSQAEMHSFIETISHLHVQLAELSICSWCNGVTPDLHLILDRYVALSTMPYFLVGNQQQWLERSVFSRIIGEPFVQKFN